MNCPHCGTHNSVCLPFDRPVAGGRAFAQTCTHCRHIVGIRPRLAGDPPQAAEEFTVREIRRLEFVRWLWMAHAIEEAPLRAA